MARITANFYSISLKRKVDINAVIPTENEYTGKFRTLYLLNGIMGDRTDWEEGTAIINLAKKYNIAVIMINGENKFYTDHKNSGDLFGEFVGDEIIRITRKMFNLSDKREDTFIGGLSMGGYGAVRNGLIYSDTFSKIAVMSAAFIVDQALESEYKHNGSLLSREYFESVFGDIDKLVGSENDYCALIDRHIKENKLIPSIYMTIGKDDFLFTANEKFDRFLCEQNVEHTYLVDEGIHDWDFWSKHIEGLIEFCVK